MRKFKHRKNGLIYRFLAFATDKTHNNELSVVYCPDNDEHDIYVRSLSDFEAKFEEMQ